MDANDSDGLVVCDAGPLIHLDEVALIKHERQHSNVMVQVTPARSTLSQLSPWRVCFREGGSHEVQDRNPSER